MGRRPRNEYPGMHHVTTLAVAGGWLFGTTEDYELRLRILAKAVRDGRWEINQFCLMGNHEHLLVTVESGGLAKAMHWVNRNYAVTFNATHGRRGCLYGRRYGSKHVADERHALWVVPYIALNPEAIANVSAETYRWSSYGSLIGLRNPQRFVNDKPVVDLFGGEPAGRRRIAAAVADARVWQLQRLRAERLVEGAV